MQVTPGMTQDQRRAAGDSYRQFQQRLFGNRPQSGGTMYAGGTPNFDERTGQYTQPPSAPVIGNAPNGRPVTGAYSSQPSPAPTGVSDMSAYSVGRAQPIQASQGTPYQQPDFQQMFSPAGFGQMFNFQGFSQAPPPPRPDPVPLPKAPYYGAGFAGGGSDQRMMVSQDFDFEEGARINRRLEADPISQRVNELRKFDAWSGQLPYGVDDFTARTQGFAGDDMSAVSKRAGYNQRAFNAELAKQNERSARIQEEERARTQQMREQAFAGPMEEHARAVAAQEAEYQQRLQRRQGAQPAFSFTVPPAAVSPADLPPDQRPPGFMQTFTDQFGNETQNNPMAQRDALIQRINEQSLPYYMGQPGQFRPNLQELWGQAGNMVSNGWANPLAGLFG